MSQQRKKLAVRTQTSEPDQAPTTSSTETQQATSAVSLDVEEEVVFDDKIVGDEAGVGDQLFRALSGTGNVPSHRELFTEHSDTLVYASASVSMTSVICMDAELMPSVSQSTVSAASTVSVASIGAGNRSTEIAIVGNDIVTLRSIIKNQRQEISSLKAKLRKSMHVNKIKQRL